MAGGEAVDVGVVGQDDDRHSGQGGVGAQVIEATTVCEYSCGLSVARLVSPCLPPVPLLALPAIAVAGPNAPCSIAPCRRTSPPGSNSPATAAMALPVQPLSNVSSAAISNAGFSRMSSVSV